MFLKKAVFEDIAHTFHLPQSYAYLRANANASGVFTKDTLFDEAGDLRKLGQHLAPQC